MFSTEVEKVALFVDAANVYYTAQALRMRVDWMKFRQMFETRKSRVAYAGYYTGVETDAEGKQRLRPLLDFLTYNGWKVISKEADVWQNGSDRKVKGNIDIELALDAIEVSEHVDRIILVTGDGDFAELVRRIHMKACRVTVVSSVKVNALSNKLRAACSGEVIDLADIVSVISQDD